MHGVILSELKKFVDERYGGDTWRQLLAAAGNAGHVYMPIRDYPDGELVAIVNAASTATGKPVDDLLQAFGEFIVPSLLDLYGSLLDSHWSAIDMLEHTEETIHRVVRLKNPGAEPPRLMANRKGPDEIEILYSSGRKMCSVAKGILKGVATAYNTRFEISERGCMNDGSPRCTLVVKDTHG